MPRKKPTSTRQKKAEVQLKRAIKRGDALPSELKKTPRRPKVRRGPTGNLVGSAADPSTVATIQAARKLQSAFVTLPPKLLEEAKLLAATLPLSRPIPCDAAVFVDIFSDADNSGLSVLTCPHRPKWRFDMTKKEVEHNEEAIFRKWLEETDRAVKSWLDQKKSTSEISDEKVDQGRVVPEPPRMMPRSPTYFERNLEVWRQLWRVTEISQIILVLLDSRCPLLHFPPSLAGYLASRKVILVLTKVDISGPARANAWSEYFRQKYPHLHTVQVESYTAKEEKSRHQGKQQYEPYLPTTFRRKLVDAIKDVHTTMLQPPDKVRANPASLKKWKAPVKRDIDWASVLDAGGPKLGTVVGNPAFSQSTFDTDTSDGPPTPADDREPEYLTIGLIGQPNVGKSSLLNALFGENKVRASKTPGKTKHFQTLFWTPEVRLVDCPGLVMPNFVPMEMQVLCGTLPISRVSAIPSCVHYAAELLPIERIYKLKHPVLSAPPIEDKRTWRDETRPESTVTEKGTKWTAMDVLIAYSELKGWVTAKAGRPDIHRAGNAILRSLAEGKVGWAFWPPDTDIRSIETESQESAGIWIPSIDVADGETEDESEEGSDHDSNEKDPESMESSEDEESDDEGENRRTHALGRFGALMIADEDDADDDDSDLQG